MLERIIIADTSCLIILSNIGYLDLLQKLYEKVTVTTEICVEFADNLPDWFIVMAASDKQKQMILEMWIGKGEASALALALENEQSLVILDDHKARKTAEKMGIKYTGTLGIIVKAKKLGLIPSVIPILDKINTTNFRISDELLKMVLSEAGENV
jgi:hypothetical protein